jgi:hypothetical protein
MRQLVQQHMPPRRTPDIVLTKLQVTVQHARRKLLPGVVSGAQKDTLFADGVRATTGGVDVYVADASGGRGCKVPSYLSVDRLQKRIIRFHFVQVIVPAAFTGYLRYRRGSTGHLLRTIGTIVWFPLIGGGGQLTPGDSFSSL